MFFDIFSFCVTFRKEVLVLSDSTLDCSQYYLSPESKIVGVCVCRGGDRKRALPYFIALESLDFS